ncbi:MAG: dTMP kinase [Pirellulales bacterium]|nr:dTMP kinase [Pirellulales bacterium]
MFITLEGPDGSGKSSQMAPLLERLQKKGYEALGTREPGGTAIGDQVRKVLFDMKNKGMHPRSEILLFQSSRAQLVEEVIRPALAAGQVVVSDRFADSTLAYQGYGHGVDLDELRRIISYATGGLQPDLTVLFDLDAEEGLARRDTGGDWNRLDDYDLAFHQRVRDGYHALAAQEPARWAMIDASQDAPAVAEALQSAVLDFLRQNSR